MQGTDGCELKGGVPFLFAFPPCAIPVHTNGCTVLCSSLGPNPLCLGEEGSSRELQNALCRRVRTVRTSFNGGPYMGNGEGGVFDAPFVFPWSMHCLLRLARLCIVVGHYQAA